LKNLRPEKWEEFIGHERVKRLLLIMKKAAKKRKEPLEPILFHGPAGCGKTTLAFLLAEKRPLIEIPCPYLSQPAEFAELIYNAGRKSFIFLDEIHALKSELKVALHKVLESSRLPFLLKKEPDFEFDISHLKLSFVAATTRLTEVPFPLRQRFEIFYIASYQDAEIAKILLQAAKSIALPLEKELAISLAPFARGVPRKALSILKRIRDISQVKASSLEEAVEEALSLLGFDEFGFLPEEREFIMTLARLGPPTGLANIAQALSLRKKDAKALEAPFLKRGFVRITAKGRELTPKGEDYAKAILSGSIRTGTIAFKRNQCRSLQAL